MNRISTLILLVAVCLGVNGQTTDKLYRDYIATYAPLAMRQHEAHGIPASITLAQGLLESAAGRSTLATRGNNHFGIKCHSNWNGETMLRNDDAPDECFRVYASAEESYNDHSRFLKGKRYARLFTLDPTDYAGWARGLRECGYATDPNYAMRLITIIERYGLYAYDSEAMRQAEATAAYIFEHLSRTHPVRKSRGLHYVIASPGDTYKSIAKEFGVKERDLARCNDASGHHGEIRAWEEVYLESKHEQGPPGVSSATIGEDESMHSVAQRYGIRMEALRKLNPNASDEPGQRLRLR